MGDGDRGQMSEACPPLAGRMSGLGALSRFSGTTTLRARIRRQNVPQFYAHKELTGTAHRFDPKGTISLPA